MIILVFASKWSLHCDFFSVFNCFCVCVFQEGISCSNVNHVHCDDHVLTTEIYKQISTIFQVYDTGFDGAGDTGATRHKGGCAPKPLL